VDWSIWFESYLEFPTTRNQPVQKFSIVLHLGDALADQIEQKIIPKFRGLDPRDHDVKSAIGKVRTVLSDLGDGLLCDAIDRLSRESQFVWLGVNRFEEELSDDLKSIGR